MKRRKDSTGTPTTSEARAAQVRRIFEDQGFGSLERLDDWDGAELEELRDVLTPEEYEILLDQLQDDPEAGR